MEVVMRIRREAYGKFLDRVRALDRSQDARRLRTPVVGSLLDCFQLGDAVAAASSKKKASAGKRKSTQPPQEGLLSRILLDYQGQNFFDSKVNATNKRNFEINPVTGFGDGMYFMHTEPDRLLRAQQQQHDQSFPLLGAFNFPFVPANNVTQWMGPVAGASEVEESDFITIERS
jgi:hypothetical protein